MKKHIFSLVLPALVLAAGMAAATQAQAQDGSSGPPVAYMGGRAVGVKPACPGVEWRVLPVAPGAAGSFSGIAYFSDMSGVSVVRGMIGADGMLTGTVASVSGKGPEGAISGRREKAITHVTVRGSECSNMQMDLRRWSPGNQVMTGGDD